MDRPEMPNAARVDRAAFEWCVVRGAELDQ
jgi:hypothetical protein